MTNYSVNLPNGFELKVTHVGIVHLCSNLILDDVLFVPSFQVNLLSVSRLVSSTNQDVVFSYGECIIQYHSLKTMTGHRKLKSGLYFLELNEVVPMQNTSCNVSTNVMFDLWHHRLGHVSLDRVKHISKIDQ